MSDDKLDRALESVDPKKRAILKKLVLGAAFSVPIIASFSVTDLHAGGIGSGGTITVTATTAITMTTVTVTVTRTTTTS
jgi:hypothetical protein